MSLYLDQLFLGKISSNFELYQIKRNSPFLAVCRCWYCGDSKKSTIKRRAYFYQKEDGILLSCKNCGITRSIKSILKESYSHYHQDYLVEQYSTNKPIEVKERQTKFEFIPKFLQENKPLRQLTKIVDLADDHHAKQFLINRQIPKDKFSELYYCDDFSSWVNKMIPGKLDSKYTEDRIVIPYLNKEGLMSGFNGRSLRKDSTKRYIAIMLVDDAPKVYNLYGIDFDVTNYVCEGALDSLFLPNALAMAGSDIDLSLISKDTSVIVMDNEPRNLQIVNKIRSIIIKGLKCVIWPSDIKEKDINLMVLSGYNVKKIVKERTFRDQQALLEFNQWTKA